MACTVGCKTCYAADQCAECVENSLYSGPNNGYCVQDSLTPATGKAQQTDFRVRDEFQFLQNNLGVAQYIATRCMYPDGSAFSTEE